MNWLQFLTIGTAAVQHSTMSAELEVPASPCSWAYWKGAAMYLGTWKCGDDGRSSTNVFHHVLKVSGIGSSHRCTVEIWNICTVNIYTFLKYILSIWNMKRRSLWVRTRRDVGKEQAVEASGSKRPAGHGRTSSPSEE